MYKASVLILLLAWPWSGVAQDIDEHNLVGFACWYGATASDAVEKVDKLIMRKKFSSIVLLLESENTAERFLAVLVCEWLTTIGKLTLTPAQMELVALAYSSEDRVSVCSGCTYWEQLPLREALHQDSYIRMNADYWFEDKFSRYKRK